MCDEQACLRIPHETKAWGGHLDVSCCRLMSIEMDKANSTHPSCTRKRQSKCKD